MDRDDVDMVIVVPVMMSAIVVVLHLGVDVGNPLLCPVVMHQDFGLIFVVFVVVVLVIFVVFLFLVVIVVVVVMVVLVMFFFLVVLVFCTSVLLRGLYILRTLFFFIGSDINQGRFPGSRFII